MEVKELISLHAQLVDLVSRVEAVLEGFEVSEPEPEVENVVELFEPTHVTAGGETVRLRDMSNIHLLRCVGKQLMYNHRERTREYIRELLAREWNGVITEVDAKRLHFCDKGIQWAKDEFSLQGNEISVRRLLRFLDLTHRERHNYEMHIVDALKDFVIQNRIGGRTRPESANNQQVA